MKMLEIVPEGAVVARLESDERDSVVAELVDALISAGSAPKKLRDELIKMALERERRGSTGFGKGVAVPHVKHDAVTKMSAAIGISAGGVEFNALDKQPVYSFILLLSPASRPDEHLQAMEVIFKNLSQDTFRRFLRQSESVDDVMTLLADADNQQLTA
ncbi:MAG: PTS sugar transporter subunit IIA [Phycisphaerales bacterium]|nr:PTS sugar transporter subunit IIA [Phycisphaerales bacterium]